jgi:anti-anti-sigma factor
MATSIPALRVFAQDRDGWTVVVVAGDLDYASWPELAECLETAVKQQPPRVAVDLSALGFCDCSGLRCLVMAAAQARRRDGQMLVLRPPAVFRKILGVTGWARALPVAVTLPDSASHVIS